MCGIDRAPCGRFGSAMQNRGCMVAMLVVGSAALTLSLSWFFYFLPKWRDLAASNVTFELERRIDAYKSQFGEWPKGGNTDILLALRGQNPAKLAIIRENDGFPVKANAFVDTWETPLAFHTMEDGRPRPVSAGRNKRHGDKDDVDATEARNTAMKLHSGKIPEFVPPQSVAQDPSSTPPTPPAAQP